MPSAGRSRRSRTFRPTRPKAPFFKPTFALKPGQVYQARPYLSPDTHTWVVSNSTPLPTQGGRRTPRSCTSRSRLKASGERLRTRSGRFDVAIVEANSGRVIVDSRYPQAKGDEAGWAGPSTSVSEGWCPSLAGPSVKGRWSSRVSRALSARSRRARTTPTNGSSSRWPRHRRALGSASSAQPSSCMGALGLLLLAYRAAEPAFFPRASTQRGDHGCPTGLGNRRRLSSGPRGALARQAPAELAARDLRPGRLQGLQRHLRSPGGRRTAQAPLGQPRKRARGSRERLPHGRRRVLRACARRRRPSRDDMAAPRGTGTD